MAPHINWTEIESFYNVRRTLAQVPELAQGNSTVTYRAKVKLHGTCACIAVDSGGNVTAMSRTAVLTPTSDNAGFAKWVAARADHFMKFAPSQGTLAIFGEWCGPGIQKGVAVNDLKEKSFVIFAARILDHGDSDFIAEPLALADFTHKTTGCYVLPWFNSGEEFTVNWNESAEALQPVIDRINAHVAHVEACDPWMMSVHGVRGVGEGLVFYPISKEHRGYESFSNLCFKAKGEQHKVVAKTKPAQAEPTVARDAGAFADMVVTPARLEQGCRAVNGGNFSFDPKNIGTFLAWISADITKETNAEREAAGLDLKTALKACTDKARAWYLAEMKKL